MQFFSVIHIGMYKSRYILNGIWDIQPCSNQNKVLKNSVSYDSNHNLKKYYKHLNDISVNLNPN